VADVGAEPNLSGLRGSVLMLRFVCELGMLAALMYWGFHVGEGAWGFVLGIGAPALAALVWGRFVAPRAKRPVQLIVRLSIEIDLFTVSAIALAFAGQLELALVLGVLGVGMSVANFFQGRRGEVVP
jgi:hypothetical protein